MEPPENKDPYLVRVRFTLDVDPDRIKEYLWANSLPDEYVEVVDRQTGQIVETIGEDFIPFVCPNCGEYAYGILTRGGTREYTHVDTDNCVIHDESVPGGDS